MAGPSGTPGAAGGKFTPPPKHHKRKSKRGKRK